MDASEEESPARDAWRFLAPATIFLAALLLFEVEPLIAKAILPWFGGSAAVWMACLLFFQAALLAGYLYAHLLARYCSPVWQTRLHIGLLIVSLSFLPILPSAGWKPAGSEDPLLLILGLLAGTVGLPFLLLSSATPLVTAWKLRAPQSGPSYSLYRLYALSNLGSMLALLSYPVLIEPLIPLRLQGVIWSSLYAGFALLSIITAWYYRHPAADLPAAQAEQEDARPSIVDRLFWFFLPLAASALLLAVTNHILRNIAAIPLLWVAPLALYLLSFVICFDSPRWYVRAIWYPLFALMAGAMIYVMVGVFLIQHFGGLLAFYAVGLYVCCIVCHGELAALKPSPRYLTSYYLCIAAGGACGGIFVAAIAPSFFNSDIDLALILPATALLVLRAAWRRLPRASDSVWAMLALAVLLVGWVVDTGRMARKVKVDIQDAKFLERNFYGALRVIDGGPIRLLRNGNIIHGREFLSPQRATEATSYYSPKSGLGLAVAQLQARGPIHVGIVGLGIGTIAAYGRTGDAYRFYEINPAVPDIARHYFRYLELCKAAWRIVMGDARLSLEREPPQKFDLLAVDAFTSDSIPMHLLTRESFALYWRHLKPDGVLAVHISNLYIDLGPVVAAAALADGKMARAVENPEDLKNGVDMSNWILITADKRFFDSPALKGARPIAVPASFRAWTDDYSNLWRSLR